jgi:hypothetical protein
MHEALPFSLLRYLPDADIEVVSWHGETGELVIRVVKDAGGPECGLARFRGVSFVSLPPRVNIIGLRCGGIDLLPEALRGAAPGPGEFVFVFDASWGSPHYVVAETVTYEVVNNE